jgi:hypothetical protein
LNLLRIGGAEYIMRVEEEDADMGGLFGRED